ncbi:MAG: undecaprenyldiphospho-muramoylpentapeptide beta-N-acetylglucosaminyltransferase [Candidatus Moranbacteria bacterium]|nr:undecaprenyldiphospho-muramoylpentapeptide beta-N-acetylglucosaminyltransferase [Candidatus Moranbacteria bacterium]
MRIVLTGGGTGGHIFPLVAVAQELRKKLREEAEILYVGSRGELEKEVMVKEGIPAKHVLSGKKRRYFSLQNFLDFFKIPLGFIQSLWILLWYMPDVVFSKGGYASIPVVLAAWLYRIPVMIHESDAVPGTANQILAKFSQRIAAAYPSAEQYFPHSQVVLTGNPVRSEVSKGSAHSARTKFEFTESKPVILVMGGSQGAQIINRAIVKILPRLLERAQVVHQTGEKNYDEVVHLAAEYGIKAGREGYAPVRFLGIDDLKNVYAAAMLVVSRAGANSIAEIAANGKTAVLVPLENSANDHQRMNAYEIARIGGALVLEETNLGENILLDKIIMLLDDEELRGAMGQKIRVFHHSDAAEKIADGLIELVH